MAEVTAQLKTLRTSPRKVRLVADVVRGMPVERAIVTLQFMKQAAAKPVAKLLSSAIANAKHNAQIEAKELWVRKITVDAGVTLHRFRPRARGTAAPIRKRTSHIAVVLSNGPKLAKGGKSV